ncbi:hypothetical protein BH09ACT10_BH09ACT10_11110 [soil metagenome]
MIVMPPMTNQQEASWHGLMDLQEILPEGWTLVGGQMVHVHCAERGFEPTRPTPDIDTVLDVKGHPDILVEFTSKLEEIGFKADPPKGEGKQHRWTRGEAMIDVLIPDSVGERAASKTGSTGSRTVETPGAQQALNRSEVVEVTVGGRVGFVRRPSLIGALVGKAAAHSITSDSFKGRHLLDFAMLASMVSRQDFEDEFSKSDKKYLRNAIPAVLADPRAVTIPGAADGIKRIETVMTPPQTGGSASGEGSPHVKTTLSSKNVSFKPKKRSRLPNGFE